MVNYVIPAVGTSGLFELSEPFDTLLIANTNYTCKSVRSLSEMNANNEDPLASIYRELGLTEDHYTADLRVDMRIVSLQAGNGHWVHVPVKYIKKYPDTNGVPYTTMGIAIELAAVPVGTSMDSLVTEIQDLIRGYLGVASAVRVVPTSYTRIVPDDEHRTIQQKRKADGVLQGQTLWQRYRTLQGQYDKLQQHNVALEKYIRDLNG